MTRRPTKPVKLSWQAIHRHLLANPGTRYTASQLANHFRQSTTELRPFLERLVQKNTIRTAVPGTTRVYFVPGAADLRSHSERVTLAPGPLKGYEAHLYSHGQLAMLCRRS